MRRLQVVLAAMMVASGLLTGTGSADPAAAGWSIQPSPNPPGSAGSALTAVSCAGDGTCTAVGLYDFSGQDVTLAEHFDASTWTLESTPNPRGARFSELTGLSCTGPKQCMAVGFWITRKSQVRPLAERRSGSTWAIEPTPKPRTAFWAILDTVSCVAATDCIAVGGFIKNGVDDQEQPLAEHWDGTAWSIERVPNPRAENGSSLNGVACVSPGACEAAGSYAFADVDQAVLAFAWNGSAWARQTEPDPGGNYLSDQYSVSCTDASACTAIGYWTDLKGRTRALAERWDGTAWRIQRVPDPKTFAIADLFGVSCSTATACTAVGDWSTSLNGLPESTLAERWNGTGWAIQSTPDPPGATASSLNGVDCSAPGVCVAVGSAEVSGVFSTLVEARAH